MSGPHGHEEIRPLASWHSVLEGLLAEVRVVPAETVDSESAIGRPLSVAVRAAAAVPAFRNSSMDGYAVLASDFETDSEARLRIVGEVLAGSGKTDSLRSGETIRIMTGAPLPLGADAVVPIEDVTHSEAPESLGTLSLRSGASLPVAGRFVREPGSDFGIGQLLGSPGDVVTPARAALLATAGVAEIPTHSRVRVGYASTGDELVAPSNSLGFGEIYDGNGPMIRELIRQWGAEVHDFGIVPDTAAAIDALLESAAQTCDLLLTTGGVSMGDRDEMKLGLQRRGVLRWHQVAIRPAKPLATAQLASLSIVGLPGNPVSARVGFELFAGPLIRTMGGFRKVHRRRVVARAAHIFDAHHDQKVHLDRGQLEFGPDRLLVSRVGEQQSHVLSGLAGAEVLVFHEPGRTIAINDEVTVLLLDGDWSEQCP